MIPLFKSNYDHQEANVANQVIASGWLSMGENVQQFEKQFGAMLGEGVNCFATTNCTMALFLAMQALDVGEGDEVLVPSLTFVADANVVKLCGAKPVFVDIAGPDNLNICEADFEKKITEKTKACILVHFAGFSCDMEKILRICNKHNIAVVEDCAHAPGATYGEQMLGTFGDVSCFSFYSNKNMSTGEGGMVCTRNGDIASKLSRLRSHGMTKPTLDKEHGRTSFYDIIEPSLNCRLDEIRGAIGIVQLEKLTVANTERQKVFQQYSKALSDTSITVPFAHHGIGRSAYHIMVVVLPAECNRDAIMKSLREDGIQSSLHYRPFWTFTAYSDLSPSDTPMLASIHDRLLTLPLSPGFTETEINTVTNTLLKLLSNHVPAS